MQNKDVDLAALHKEWDEALCPICMDHPHNAVLLLCTSHEKGCRSYICDTSYRHSNCLDRFRKMRDNQRDRTPPPSNSGDHQHHRRTVDSEWPARSPRFRFSREIDSFDHEATRNPNSAREDSTNMDLEIPVIARAEVLGESSDSSELSRLKCPLCRCNIEGWKIVKEARMYLDEKPRTCARESCTFSGNYKELRRHARRVHPATRPADVDPSRRRSWQRLEHQREYGDLLSAIRSAMPGAIVFGDYVIDSRDMPHNREGGGGAADEGQLWTTLLLFHMISSPFRPADELRGGASRGIRRQRRRHQWGENLLGVRDNNGNDREDDNDNIPRRRRRRFERSRSEEHA